MRIVTIEELQKEIREYGITRMAREIGCSRQHLQRICGGQRKPGRAILAALCYEPLLRYIDVMPAKESQTTPK